MVSNTYSSSIRTIAKTLESRRSINYNNYETIIVDRSSDDGTMEVMRKFSVNKIVERQIGKGIAYNSGLLEAKEKYVAF
ncbi:MAG: glycosyltransferase family A protein [Desulfurococcaceae archaeon]